MIEWGLPILLAALVAAPFLRESLRPRMDKTARRDAPGSFAELPNGVTHYRWLGPPDGPVAVLVHGLTTPSFVWNPIARGLVDMGFRVLLYDLYGRGYSDRPHGAQDAAFFVSQLEDLLDDQDIEEDITIMGYSMGGAVAAAFAARHAARIRQAVLIAPAGMGHDLGPVARLVINHNWLGRWVMMAFYARSYRHSLEAERNMESSIDNMVDRQAAELEYRGFTPSVLRSMRGILDGDLEAEHRRMAEAGVPVLAIWGREDEIIPITGLGRLAKWNRDARQEVIEGAGHALAYTHDRAVLEILGNALLKPRAPDAAPPGPVR